jgi:hypothetical protein
MHDGTAIILQCRHPPRFSSHASKFSVARVGKFVAFLNFGMSQAITPPAAVPGHGPCPVRIVGRALSMISDRRTPAVQNDRHANVRRGSKQACPPGILSPHPPQRIVRDQD